jgi:hypothetical protein
MLKQLATTFGVILLLVGVLGFVPGITTDGLLLGIFQVDTIHNVIHLLSGAIALWAGMTSMSAAKMYFQIFGVVYALVTVLGFVAGGSILGLFAVNMADNLLHVVIAVVALWAGFGMKGGESMPMNKPAM